MKRVYVDPITGVCQETKPTLPEALKNVVFPVINFVSDSGTVLVEHVVDEDIHSLSLNVVFRLKPEQAESAQAVVLIDTIKGDSFHFLNQILDCDFGVESLPSHGALSISVPDYASCPSLQTEKLAEMLLERIDGMIVQCKHCKALCLRELSAKLGKCHYCHKLVT